MFKIKTNKRKHSCVTFIKTPAQRKRTERRVGKALYMSIPLYFIFLLSLAISDLPTHILFVFTFLVPMMTIIGTILVMDSK